MFTSQIDRNIVRPYKPHDKIGSPPNECLRLKRNVLDSSIRIQDTSKNSSKIKKILNENFPNCPLKRNYERIWQNNNNPNFKF